MKFENKFVTAQMCVDNFASTTMTDMSHVGFGRVDNGKHFLETKYYWSVSESLGLIIVAEKSVVNDEVIETYKIGTRKQIDEFKSKWFYELENKGFGKRMVDHVDGMSDRIDLSSVPDEIRCNDYDCFESWLSTCLEYVNN